MWLGVGRIVVEWKRAKAFVHGQPLFMSYTGRIFFIEELRELMSQRKKLRKHLDRRIYLVPWHDWSALRPCAENSCGIKEGFELLHCFCAT